MKVLTLALCLSIGLLNYVNSQCDIDFSTINATIIFSGDIVNAATGGANATHSQSFDIWDNSGAVLDCTLTGGTDDITFDFSIINTLDSYGGAIIDAEAGTTHDVVQDGTGLKGSIPLGTSGANQTSVGDARGYSIEVTFSNDLIIYAQDITVNMTSINTRGSAFESSALVFKNEAGAPYGSATFEGYYGNGSSGASTTACTTPVAGNSWSTSGTGLFVAASTGTVNMTDPCNPTGTGASNGPMDGKDVAATADAGLSNLDRVGGFTFTVYLEDIAAANNVALNETSTSTSFSSTLNSLTIAAASLLPVELVSFNAHENNGQVDLKWSTASELNNDLFEIQRSTDGDRFETLGFVRGQGTTYTSSQYQFSDQQPSIGIQYYRLKQIDFDGRFAYSKIVSVQLDPKETISIYPTIAKEYITLTTLGHDRPTNYLIFNSYGQTVLSGQTNGAAREQQIAISSLSGGFYFLQAAVNTSYSSIHKFQKIN